MSAAFDIIDEEQPEDLRSTGERPRVAIPHELERAKRLRLGEHLANVATISPESMVEFAPSRLSSVVRSRGRRGGAALFVELMVIAGVTSADVASAMDVVPQRVAQMRCGERAVELGDLLLMVERLPAVREVLLRMLGERVGGER